MRALLAAPVGTLLALSMALGSLVTVSAHAAVPVGEWNFIASLNDKPIGEHRFNMTGSGDEQRMVSEANFNVKFLGISAYRYQHKAVEKWRNNCLTEMVSKTDDDGKVMRVRTEADGNAGLTVFTDDTAGLPVPGCVMSFAYWNPVFQTQTRLLNAQTGKPEKVQITRAGDGQIEVRGQTTTATRWRIAGATVPIDVWYSAAGDWIGLDSAVGGGRKLSYRLK